MDNDGEGAAYEPPPPRPPKGVKVRSVLRATGRATGRGGRAGARAVAKGSQASARAFVSFVRRDGADSSGLARLTEMHTVQVAADAALTVSLAGTVFAMPTGQARGRVALFLVLTMAPFVLLAPFVGPLLDRFRHGRRWALGATLALRGFLAWVLASAVVDQSWWLFPTALACLVASKAYAVARAAAVPRLLPPGLDLVTANSRLTVAGLVGMGIGGGLAVGLSRIGPEWSLRLAFAIYVAATVLAIRLPDRVDTPVTPDTPRITPTLRSAPEERLRELPHRVRHAFALIAGARFLVGFLTLYVLFLAREVPLPGWSTPLTIGAAVAAAGLGNVLGSIAGNRPGLRPTPTIVAMALSALLGCVLVAFQYSWWSLLIVSFVGGVHTQLGKLCLDALVQSEVPESRHARVFAWIETVLQLAWVLGGAVAIVVPLLPHLGFSVAAAGLLTSLVLAVKVLRSEPRPLSGRSAASP